MAKYGAVQFTLSPVDAQRVLDLQKGIEESELAPKGRELTPHVTVRWGFHPEVTPDQVSAITKGTGTVDVTFGDLHAFPENDEGEPLVFLLESEKLVKLHDALAALPHTDPHPTFQPHLTIGYFKKGMAQKHAQGENPLKGQTITLRDLQFRSREKTFTDLEKGYRETFLQKPYSSASDAPDYVRQSKRKQWVAVWNSAYERAKKDGKSDKEAESSAFAQANGVAGPNSSKKFAKLLAKADADDAQAFTDRLITVLEAQWLALPSQVRSSLESAALSGAGHGLLQIDVSNSKLIASANRSAQEYATHRAAEMIGKKFDNEGNLVENPNARWAISQTTRDKIRQIVADSFTKETPISEVVNDIREALAEETEGEGIFSLGRAKMIARSEIAMAQSASNFSTWEKSGVVEKVKWLTSNLDPCPECLMNQDQEVEIGSKFFSGATKPPQHPHCACVLAVSKVSEDA
jgi:hypothetical protein